MSDRAADVRKKFPRFRILVIGRANAGKTTLLQRVCKTTESPIVRNQWGRMVSGRLLCRQQTVYANGSLQINTDVKGTVGVVFAYRRHALF
jgi:GTPase SAR1 family protein